MSDEELAQYKAEFVELLYEFAKTAHSTLSDSVCAAQSLLELHQEQIKAAYTNGYEDHAAMSLGPVH